MDNEVFDGELDKVIEHYGRLGMKWYQHIFGEEDGRAKYIEKGEAKVQSAKNKSTMNRQVESLLTPKTQKYAQKASLYRNKSELTLNPFKELRYKKKAVKNQRKSSRYARRAYKAEKRAQRADRKVERLLEKIDYLKNLTPEHEQEAKTFIEEYIENIA